jgi:hypothetical protein
LLATGVANVRKMRGRLVGPVVIAVLGGAIASLGAAAAYAAAGSSRSVKPTQLAAERLIYDQLDPPLQFVGATRTTASGALAWLSVPGDDSGNIACMRQTPTFFKCEWTATLIQSYRGRATVRFSKHVSQVAFFDSTCVNPGKGAPGYPNLCALDPVPGMRDT